MEAEKDKSAEVDITKEESEVTRDNGEIESMLGDITREDLDMLDKIFTNMQINQQDNVDVEQLKQDLTKSDICPEEKKQLLISILNDVEGDLHWTNVLDETKIVQNQCTISFHLHYREMFFFLSYRKKIKKKKMQFSPMTYRLAVFASNEYTTRIKKKKTHLSIFLMKKDTKNNLDYFQNFFFFWKIFKKSFILE